METVSPVTPSPPHDSPSQRSSILLEARLWRPAAQRNLRNQWSKVSFFLRDWRAAAAAARSHATTIVNSYLSRMYMNGKDFGVLNDMPNIREKAMLKFLRQQELCMGKLVSSYREMVKVSVTMFDTCKFMRCDGIGSSNILLSQFDSSPQNSVNESDFKRIPVFTFYSVPFFEELAWEIFRMFISELSLKRLLGLEFLTLYDDKVAKTELKWSDELYDGEFYDLRLLGVYSNEANEPVPPHIRSDSCTSFMQAKQQHDSSTLQVYLITWLKDVNIDKRRVDEILGIVGSEMHTNFLERIGA